MEAAQLRSRKYRVVRRVGEGGMGYVFEAEHLRLGRRVAIKRMHRDEAAPSPRLRRWFEREARALSRLQSPHVVRVYDIELDDEGEPFIVMELLAGKPLSKVIYESYLTTPQILEYVRDAVRGLAAAHAERIVHCDIKPDNIFVTDALDGPLVKLIDFGIAKELDQATSTGASVIAGTVRFMSPEQLQGRPPTLTSDVFSMGVTLYHLLTNDWPFESASEGTYMLAVLAKPAVALRVRRPDLDPALERIVMRCIERDPERRYPSALELERELNQLISPAALDCATTDVVAAAPILVNHSATIRSPLPRPLGRALGVGAALVALVAFVALSAVAAAPERKGPAASVAREDNAYAPRAVHALEVTATSDPVTPATSATLPPNPVRARALPTVSFSNATRTPNAPAQPATTPSAPPAPTVSPALDIDRRPVRL